MTYILDVLHSSHTCYNQVLGKSEVAVPTHLFKIIIGRHVSDPGVSFLGAFVVPNEPISKDHILSEYQVSGTYNDHTQLFNYKFDNIYLR